MTRDGDAEAVPWPGPRPFVGRDNTLQTLLSEVDAAADGGRALFLTGPPGSGKTELLSLFQELAVRRHKALDAQYVDCVHTGPGNEAWVQLARLLTGRHRIRDSTKRLTMEWLQVAPIVGALLRAVVATVNAIRTGRAEVAEEEELVGSDATSAVAHVRLLLRHDPLEHRLVILDNLEEADAHELAGSFALVRQLDRTRTLFVGGVSVKRGQTPEGVEALILEAERLGRTRVLRLPGLGAEAIGEAVEKATGTTPPPEWVEWIVDRTGGRPADVWKVLGELVSRKTLLRRRRGWEWREGPPPVDSPADAGSVDRQQATDRLTELDPGDRRLLALAALQGTVFRAGAVAELGGMDELDVEDELAKLARQGWLEPRDAVEIGGLPETRYAFRDAGLREASLAELGTQERQALAARLPRGVGDRGNET